MAAPMIHARLALRLIQFSAKTRFLVHQPRQIIGGFTQITRHLADDTSKEDEAPEKPRIELSHPKGRKQVAETSESSSSSSSSDSGNDSSDSSSSDSDSDIDPEVVSAVGDVAKALGGDINQTASDLLTQLQSHQDLTTARKAGEDPHQDISEVIEGMQVDRRQNGMRRDGHQIDFPEGILAELQHDNERQQERQNSRRYRERGGKEINLKLFDGKGLGIFTKAAEIGAVTEVTEQTSLFDRLQREEFERKVNYPAENAFEEQIRWTREGKLWKFPIDNEQGMEEEAKVGFHEHVFLEPLIADFPKKGPLRHFMELVCVGLSKNAYLTVAEKHEHIDWFRKYFAEKKHILDEVIIDPESSKSEAQPKLA